MTRKRLALVGAGLAVAIGLVAAAAFGAFSSSVRSSAAGVDSVRVHGNWTIAVLSKSGKVVRTYRFHNDFQLGQFSGDAAFSGILSGGNAPGDWDVSLQGTACANVIGSFCQLFEPDANTTLFDPTADRKNLTVSVPTTGTDAFKVVLSGNLPAPLDGQITRVSTGLQRCSTSSTVGQDCGAGYNAITDRTLASPISVSAGQNMVVTVKISFGA